MNDLGKFEHGQEGTHYACNARLELLGALAPCCGCESHNCDDSAAVMVQNNFLQVQPGGHCFRCHESFSEGTILTHLKTCPRKEEEPIPFNCSECAKHKRTLCP